MEIFEITMISGAKYYVNYSTLNSILNSCSKIGSFIDIKTCEAISIFVDKIESFKLYKEEIKEDKNNNV